MVDPKRRCLGYGSATILAVVEHQDLVHIRLFFGSVEADNVEDHVASVGATGFRYVPACAFGCAVPGSGSNWSHP